MNDHVMRRLGVSRRELFETIERHALAPLPADDCEFAEWRRARVNLDYHIEVRRLPLFGAARADPRRGRRARRPAARSRSSIAANASPLHQRRYRGRKHGTDPDHMPSSHRRYAEWTPDRFRRWAGKIGPNTEGLIIAVLASRPHPEQGFRTCLGILRLSRPRSRPRRGGLGPRRRDRRPQLQERRLASSPTNLDRRRATTEPAAVIDHANLRGPGYFH